MLFFLFIAAQNMFSIMHKMFQKNINTKSIFFLAYGWFALFLPKPWFDTENDKYKFFFGLKCTK